MNNYTYNDHEKSKNYMWNKYFRKSLEIRKNWTFVDYQSLLNSPRHIDLVYSPAPRLNRLSKISGSIYHLVDILSDKVAINQKLLKLDKEYLPRMLFFKKNLIPQNEITELLGSTKSFFYLKSSSGSLSKGVFIVRGLQDILKILESEISDSWLLSENIDSWLFRRTTSYQPNGINYSEQYGHRGRLKFFILFKINSTKKEVYMYDKSIFELAPDEFKGDYTSFTQNTIIGIGSKYNKVGYPKDYDVDPDYAFDSADIFGNYYFTYIIPQLSTITNDIFEVTSNELNCKNGKLYNDSFKDCFHLASVDIIIDKSMKCYFLELNTRPAMNRPVYEKIFDYPTMIDSVVQICIDPYISPWAPSHFPLAWHLCGHASIEKNRHTYYVSPTWKLSEDMKKLFQERKNWQEVIYPKNILSRYKIDFVGKKQLPVYIKDPIFEKGVLISKIHTLNHYLGNKKIMYDILSNDPKAFDFLPLTATFNTSESDFHKVIKHAMEYSESIKTWILKPAVGLQGKDIFISSNYTEVIEYILLKPEYTEWVLSQYIDNPFLLKLHGNPDSGAKFNDSVGRKNHIRIYVLITKIDNVPHIYIYDRNLIFCAVEEYRYSDLKYEYSNLTNLHLGSIFYNDQLKIDGSLAYQDLSFLFKETVDELYGPRFYKETVFPQIKNMLKVILDNSVEYLNCANKGGRGCFQYIAIDIMPDIDFKLYLLEINGRPGMNAPSYHWGSLKNFANSLINKTSDVINKNKRNVINRKGFILVH